jgi:hypothetical protein
LLATWCSPRGDVSATDRQDVPRLIQRLGCHEADAPARLLPRQRRPRRRCRRCSGALPTEGGQQERCRPQAGDRAAGRDRRPVGCTAAGHQEAGDPGLRRRRQDLAKVVLAPAGKGTYKAIFTTPKNAKTVSLKAHLIDAEGNASHRLGGRRSCGHGVHRRAECRPRITGVLKPPHSCCRQYPVAEHDRSAAVAEVQPQGHAIGVDRPATQRGRLDPGLPCRRSARRRGPANTTAGSVRVGHAAIAGRRTIIPRHPRVPAHAPVPEPPSGPRPGTARSVNSARRFRSPAAPHMTGRPTVRCPRPATAPAGRSHCSGHR